MNIRQIVLAGVTSMLILVTFGASAARPISPSPGGGGPPFTTPPGGPPFLTPEIDAASGTSAIALLAGVLLLAGERSRSRRP